MIKQFEISGKLIGFNEYINLCRRNKYSANNVKKKIDNNIIECIKKQIGNVRFKNKVTLEFHWIEPNRKRDLDNIAFAKKFILDALVKAKIIENDGWKNIEGFNDYFSIDKENEKIIVKIIEDKIFTI